MKILMLTPYLPYPLFSGGQIRSYNIIKQLSKKHEVTLFALIRSDEEQKYIPEVEKYCRKVVVFKRKKAFTFRNILLSGFTHKPFILHVYNNIQLRESLREELEKEHYDLIHVETFYVMHNLPAGRHGILNTSVPLVLFEQNIEYDVYRRIAQYFRPSFLRPLLLFDVFKMKKWEEYFWKKANGVVVMSKREKSFVPRDVFVCGNGVDVENFKFHPANWRIKSTNEKRILFIGNFKWFENLDAASFMLKEVWPRIKLKVKSEKLKVDLKLWIVGRKIPDSVRRLTDDSEVIFDEDAPEETRKIYEQASALLAPIRAGGGTSFKVLEAMASGLPVVTTPLVADALEARDGEELLVASKANEFAEKAIEILGNEKQYEQITVNARKLVEEKYDWKVIVEKLEKVYQELVTLN